MDGAIAQVKNVERIWLSNKEAQVYLGMSQDFFHQLRRTGQLAYYQVGNKAVFYKKEDIDRLLENSLVKIK